MPLSRAIVVLGMHRSGTSVLTRGLQALGVYLGDDFLGTKPDNPTGYWENRVIVDLNERVLNLLGLKWESVSLIQRAQLESSNLEPLREEATNYLRTHFAQHPLWGFKDPRTIRLLPFWRSVFKQLGVDDSYVLAIRNPLSVAASLLRRQNMSPETSHLLSLVYLVPFLDEIVGRRFAVTDYDLLLVDPRGQLGRVKSRLRIQPPATDPSEIEYFATHFLDIGLRHGFVGRRDFDAVPGVSPLIRQAYFLLHQLATDQLSVEAPEFWQPWNRLRGKVEALIPERTSPGAVEPAPPETGAVAEHNLASRAKTEFRFADRPPFPGTGVKLFVVIGAQRTGTNLLREILNTNEKIAMLGEILWPNPAPAHWSNFLRQQQSGRLPPGSPEEMEDLLDRYFAFVLYRIRNHWIDCDKSKCEAIGVDIKYYQLRYLAPTNWDPTATPFLLSYLRSRGAKLIHTTRKNIIECAISAMIAAERNIWHNYEGTDVDNSGYSIDVAKCLAHAQEIISYRDDFLEHVKGSDVTECCYEDLKKEIEEVTVGELLPSRPGPLADIARALSVPFEFRYEGRLRKAIDIPYSRLLLNKDALLAALKQSQFSPLATTLE